MIKFINVFENSLSLAYNTAKKAEENLGDKGNGYTRVIFVETNGNIRDITDIYNASINN